MTHSRLYLVYTILQGLVTFQRASAVVTLQYDAQNITDEDIYFDDARVLGDSISWFPNGEIPRLRQGIRVEIGTPPQTVWLNPSLILDEIVVRNVSSCYNTIGLRRSGPPTDETEYLQSVQCEWVAQGLYNSHRSSSYDEDDDKIQIPPTRWSGDDGANTNVDGDIVNGTHFEDEIRFPNVTGDRNSLSDDDMEMALHLYSDNWTNHPNILGLGRDSEFLDQFFPRNKVFGMSFPRLPNEPTAMIELDFDGVNMSKSTGEVFSTRFPSGNGVYPFTLTIDSMDINGVELLDEPLTARIDLPNLPGSKLPAEIFYRFANETGAFESSREVRPDPVFAWYIDPVPADLADQWVLTVRFSNGYTTRIPQQYLVNNITWNTESDSSLDLPPYVSAFTNMELADEYAVSQMLPGPVIGWEFFQFTYFMVDYERNQFSMATHIDAARHVNGTNGDDTAPPPNNDDDTPPDADTDGQSGGNNTGDNDPNAAGALAVNHVIMISAFLFGLAGSLLIL